MNAVLVADFGNVHTRLVLIDLVDGQYRLVASSRARTTAEPPLGQVALGLEHAADAMTRLTGRTLLDADSDSMFVAGAPGNTGIDAFLATGSAGRPMRVFLVGLTPELSLASAQRALGGTYVTIVDTLTPDDPRSEEEQINAIVNSGADLIMIAGGTDGGATVLLQALLDKINLALDLSDPEHRPSVLYAGNRALRRAVKTQFDPLTRVFVSKNVRPETNEEELFPAQIELAFFYDEYRSNAPGGFGSVGRLSSVGVVPTTQGYISAVRYMGSLPGDGIGPLCIDVGSANSMIAASVDGTPRYRIRTDLGMGHNIVSALETVTPDAVRRWLPFAIDDAALWDYAHNKQLRPSTIPGTGEDLLLEQALAREIVRQLVADARPTWGTGESVLLPPFSPIIAAGAALTETQHPGISALLLLDALQPVGMVDLRLDPHNLIASLGVVAYLEPIITVQALEAGGLIDLGTAFCPLGRVRQGRKAMKVRLTYGEDRRIEREIRGGEMWVAPLLPGEQVKLDLRLARGLSINGRRRIKRRLTAGAAGLIFDARGRPLALPRGRDRELRFTEWRMAMMGREPRPADGDRDRHAVPAAPPEGEGHALPS